MVRKIVSLLLALALMLSCAFAEVLVDIEEGIALDEEYMVEFGMDYTSKEEVSMYLYAFGELPPNFITKQEARDLGWVSRWGNLWDVAYGMSIGGDEFGNREGLLPRERGRIWYECDINYQGGYREGERIVFSNDGLIYYSSDHYEGFECLYENWYEEGYIYGLEEDAA